MLFFIMFSIKMKNAPGWCLIPVLLLMFIIVVSWVWNLVKLCQCDFTNATTWKYEVIHALGLIPIFSPITVWFPVG